MPIHWGTLHALTKLTAETGNLLEASQEELKYGEWGAMFQNNEVPFSRSTAFKLIAISTNDNVRDDARVQQLPVHWGTLYELTKLTDEQFENGIKSGVINPNMQRKDVNAPAADRVSAWSTVRFGRGSGQSRRGHHAPDRLVGGVYALLIPSEAPPPFVKLSSFARKLWTWKINELEFANIPCKCQVKK